MRHRLAEPALTFLLEQKELGSELLCKANGSPAPEISWTYNGEVLSEYDGKEALVIDEVNRETMGTYACNASNVAGYVYKVVPVNILVQRPFFLEKMGKRTAAVGMSGLKLRCSAKGYPEPEYSWTFKVFD